MFSRAEQAVVDLLKTGLSNKEMADCLFVTEKTVKFHLTRIYKKAGVRGRSEFSAKQSGVYMPKQQIIEGIRSNSYRRSNDVNEIPTGSNPVVPQMNQSSRQVQVVGRSQEDKITFIDEKFKVGDTITQLHSMMKDVTSKELTPATVNAACNCVARLNETINTAIQAARFLNER